MEDQGATGLPASIEAAWGVRTRPSKGPRPALSLERIVAAAVRVAAGDGLQAVSMGRVASDLGVSTMSLYRYVGAKDELLERFDLTDAGRRTVATWSGGMRRRLDLAAGLVADPEVVFLEEADRLAGQIALLDGGRVVATGSPAQLKRRVARHRLDLVLADARAFAEADRRLGDPVVQRDPARLTVGVATDGSAAEVRALLDEVDPARRAVATFAVHSASLDDVFLALTGHPTGRPDHDKEPASV